MTKSVLVSNGCVACNMCVTLAGRPYSVPALPILACPIHLGILHRQFLSSLPDDDTHVRLSRHGAKKFCNPHSGVTQPGVKKFCSYPGQTTETREIGAFSRGRKVTVVMTRGRQSERYREKEGRKVKEEGGGRRCQRPPGRCSVSLYVADPRFSRIHEPLIIRI